MNAALMNKERQRILSGSDRKKNPSGRHVTSYLVKCPGNAQIVLERAKQLLSLVLTYNVQDWPSGAQWIALLPEWFLSRCAPEGVQERERWNGVTAKEQN